jgi:putative phosphoribosyl transferase
MSRIFMEKYRNRQEAGKVLAQELRAFSDRNDVIVLALPRGGVPVAFEIVKALHVPLDVFIVRKLGVPGHSELAMGAIAMGGAHVFNDEIIRDLSISPETIQRIIETEQQELKRRESAYRGNHTFPPLKDTTVILVDDGIATGATMRAAIKALRQLNPAAIVVAVPVADKQMCEKFEPLVDSLICPLRPSNFFAVGPWYDDFSQTEDEEVYTLLKQAKTLFSLKKENKHD